MTLRKFLCVIACFAMLMTFAACTETNDTPATPGGGEPVAPTEPAGEPASEPATEPEPSEPASEPAPTVVENEDVGAEIRVLLGIANNGGGWSFNTWDETGAVEEDGTVNYVTHEATVVGNGTYTVSVEIVTENFMDGMDFIWVDFFTNFDEQPDLQATLTSLQVDGVNKLLDGGVLEAAEGRARIGVANPWNDENDLVMAVDSWIGVELIEVTFTVSGVTAPANDAGADAGDVQSILDEVYQAEDEFLPLWMQPDTVVIYDGDMGVSFEQGGKLTAADLEADPAQAAIIADLPIWSVDEREEIRIQPFTRVSYDLHGFLGDVQYMNEDGEYRLDPADWWVGE
ncbi:MAG: hypothetical protein FWH20_10710 [Oscillospiraceae bacterium]|nr:hypothetical protein [Oscillospiraceae bacterium]